MADTQLVATTESFVDEIAGRTGVEPEKVREIFELVDPLVRQSIELGAEQIDLFNVIVIDVVNRPAKKQYNYKVNKKVHVPAQRRLRAKPHSGLHLWLKETEKRKRREDKLRNSKPRTSL